jgi:hypothetical protein
MLLLPRILVRRPHASEDELPLKVHRVSTSISICRSAERGVAQIQVSGPGPGGSPKRVREESPSLYNLSTARHGVMGGKCLGDKWVPEDTLSLHLK